MYPNSRKRCDTLFSATTKVGKRRTERRMIQQTNGENCIFLKVYICILKGWEIHMIKSFI